MVRIIFFILAIALCIAYPQILLISAAVYVIYLIVAFIFLWNKKS